VVTGTINKQKNKNGSVRQYLQICRTFRVDNKVRQQTLCNLGRLEHLLENGSVDNINLDRLHLVGQIH